MSKLVITATGGHTLAALAVTQELKKKGNWDIYWIGATHAIENLSVPTLEEQILPGLDIPFYRLNTGKIHRRKVWKTPLSLLRLPLGFFQALRLLLRIKPRIILSFGGFVSVPVAFAGWGLRIPIIVHEQTSTSGLANRVVARIAAKVAISAESSAPSFPKEKVVLTGNPVRKEIWQIAEDRRRKTENGFRKTENRKQTIYITGGSRGSQVINKAVFSVLSELLDLGEVYHQTGVLDYQKSRLAARYHIYANVTPQQAEEIYQKATLVISRAGANTVSELEVLGIPAILIPIPWAERDEQTKNARVLTERGNGIILPQEELSRKTLLAKVKEILKNPQNYKPTGRYRLARKNAAQNLVRLIKSVV